jgi:ribonuclease HII
MSLEPYYHSDENIIEIGVDEVGRGPMFGRVYCAAVILPKNNDFQHNLIKDSKKFHSKKKINTISDYIKNNASEYVISYEDEKVIDKENIKAATYIAMHKAIKELLNNIKFFENLQNKPDNSNKSDNLNKSDKYYNKKFVILVDGNDFKPFTYLDLKEEIIKELHCKCIIGGDNKFTPIAAASILAKVARDKYIDDLCEKYPKLDEYYDLSKNKGYGTAKHMEGIKKYGITEQHRRSFGLCKNANIIDL